MKKRNFAIAMTVALIACGSMSTTVMTLADNGSDEQVVLEFWNCPFGNDQFDRLEQELIEEYEAEHPNVTVNYTPVSWDNWYQTFASAVASHTAPDVSGGGGYMAFQLYDEGGILPVDDVIEELIVSGEADNYLNECYKYMHYDGHYLAFPWNFSVRVIGVNTDLLAQAGVEKIPSNWDEFHDACKAVVENTDAYGFAISGDNTGKQLTMGFLHSNDGGLFTEDMENDVMSEQNIETLTYLTSLAEEGLLDPAGASKTYGETQKDFEAGKLAFLCSSSTYFMTLENKYDWVDLCNPLASYSGGYGTHTGVNSIMVYNDTEHPQEAKEFALWWTKNNYRLFEEGGADGVPVWKEITEKSFYTDSRLFDKILNDWLPTARILGNKGSSLVPQLNIVDSDQRLMDMAQGITLGVDPAESLQEVSDAVDEAFGY